MGVTGTPCNCVEYHLHIIKISLNFDLESSSPIIHIYMKLSSANLAVHK